MKTNEFTENARNKMYADLEQVIALTCGFFGLEAYEKIKELAEKYGNLE